MNDLYENKLTIKIKYRAFINIKLGLTYQKERTYCRSFNTFEGDFPQTPEEYKDVWYTDHQHGCPDPANCDGITHRPPVSPGYMSIFFWKASTTCATRT